MASTVSSRKQKGNRLQNDIIKKLLNSFQDLTTNDLRSVPGSVPGEDIWMSEKAKSIIGFAIEAKNQEKISIWKCLEQAEDPKRKGTPLLVFKRNRSDVYCCLKFDDFLKLLTMRS